MKLKTYTPEFRAEAVKVVLAQGLSLERQRSAWPSLRARWRIGSLQPNAVVALLQRLAAVALASWKRKWRSCARNSLWSAWRRKY